MTKNIHEIRDPIHVFIRLTTDKRSVLDSRPFQRLRHIHQLAMTYLVYPSATHKRFEHSLGVMELASRIYDVVTSKEIPDEIKNLLPDEDQVKYWKKVLCMAALCHDMGHLPFSHAAERELLPEGWDHERLTREIIVSEEMRQIWNKVTPPLRPDDIVKLAVGPNKARDLSFTNWETILSEIIVGDVFGADRMDYLLRDSHHLGVAYGRFDHYRLIDTIRILPQGKADDSEDSREPSLGVEEGGLQSAEAMLLARYLMFSQVYLHPVRRSYDIHLKEFLKQWLPEGLFPTDIEGHLALTDNEVLAALAKAEKDGQEKGHEPARRILRRGHFKVVYQPNPDDKDKHPEPGLAFYAAAKKVFDPQLLRHDLEPQTRGNYDFPVQMRDGRIASSLAHSEVLRNVPLVSVDNVLADRSICDKVEKWIRENRVNVLSLTNPTEED